MPPSMSQLSSISRHGLASGAASGFQQENSERIRELQCGGVDFFDFLRFWGTGHSNVRAAPHRN